MPDVQGSTLSLELRMRGNLAVSKNNENFHGILPALIFVFLMHLPMSMIQPHV